MKSCKKVNKSVWGMPGLLEATKDVVSCDKPRGFANWNWSEDFRMGQPGRLMTCHTEMWANPLNWNILVGGGKERNIDFLSSGERKGSSLNRFRYGVTGVVGLRYSSDCELERSGKFGHRGWKPRIGKFVIR